MVLLYGLTAVLGGLLTTALLWQYGAILAILAYPLGGSGFTLLVAALVFMAGPERKNPVRLTRTRAHSARFVSPLRATAGLAHA